MSQPEQRISIVTGAGQGIGRAIAIRLAAAGDLVIAVDLNLSGAKATAAMIAEQGGACEVESCDLEKPDATTELFSAVHKRHTRIDVSVHNVGGTIWTKPFERYKVDEVRQELSRSLMPTLWCCHAVLPYMISQQDGVIINIGSIATRGVNRAPYAASKGGVASLTTVLALENAKHGIRVNCVSPGGIEVKDRTIPRNENAESPEDQRGMEEVMEQTLRDTPLGTFGEPADIAESVYFLASRNAKYITGQNLFVAGGAIG